ncbi:hypothetical protein [Burkholderia sp. Ax-1719]|uniref:hypothetical protein n=1 Tax=Burkholderia sp. Ax-1719 TaxID=2608334 RepID=UPI001423D794|nr:hypothetical protein [Burkholderia sp. Ax-1719]NIE67487.1 hypothetical protein [Burkholderia sp. Ax-1719]
MPKTKDIKSTSLRLPRALHAQLEQAASAGGVTLSSEMIFRLQHDPRADYAKAILEELRARDLTVEHSLRKQIETLWGALDRADDVLCRVEEAMALVAPDSAPGALRREVEFARQLIAALDAHR